MRSDTCCTLTYQAGIARLRRSGRRRWRRRGRDDVEEALGRRPDFAVVVVAHAPDGLTRPRSRATTRQIELGPGRDEPAAVPRRTVCSGPNACGAPRRPRRHSHRPAILAQFPGTRRASKRARVNCEHADVCLGRFESCPSDNPGVRARPGFETRNAATCLPA